MAYLSKDYHDYVFKNGKFIGLFDDMYKYSKDVPWHQDIVSFQWFHQIGILMIRDIVKERKRVFSNILEIGCGLGYTLAQLKNYGKRLYGCDISTTAIQKAKRLHEGISFFTWDVREQSKNIDRKLDLVIVSELMWYVLDNLTDVKRNIISILSRRGYFLFRQTFPDLKSFYVGKKIFPSPESIVRFWNDFEIIHWCEMKKISKRGGPHLWFLGRKK